MVYFKDKLPKLGNRAIINKKSKPDMEVKMKPAAIPKLRMDDFNQLIKFGFDVDDAVSAINASNSFSSTLGHLTMRNNTSKMIGNENGKEKTNADSENGIQTLKTEYVFIGDVWAISNKSKGINNHNSTDSTSMNSIMFVNVSSVIINHIIWINAKG